MICIRKPLSRSGITTDLKDDERTDCRRHDRNPFSSGEYYLNKLDSSAYSYV